MSRMNRCPAYRGTDLVANRRVKITAAASNWTDGATVGYADADDTNWIGTTVGDVTGEGPITVNLRNEPEKIEVTGAISAGADVFAATNGRGAASGSVKIGVALEASTASGDIINYIPTSN